MPAASPLLVAQAASALASALVAWKLYSTGLYKKYPVLFTYMLFRVANLAGFAPLNVRSHLYFKAFVVVQPFVWFFYVAVVVELIRLVLSRYRGLHTAAKWALGGAMLISVAISGAVMAAHITPEMPQSSVALGVIIAVDRSLAFSLALALLALLGLLNFSAVPLSRNVLVHAVVYTLYFLCVSFSTYLRAIFGLKSIAFIDAGSMAAASLCVMAWFLFLTRKGEETPRRIKRITPDQEQEMLRSLELINANLLRIARK
jgi:hypothetical protein